MPTSPTAIEGAEILNARRFLSLDLNYGRRVDSEMYQFLLDNGMTRDEYQFFLTHHLRQHCIMGNDYYITNEHRVARRRADLGGGRNVRIRRDHAAVLRPLSPSGHAHRDEPGTGCQR